MSQINVLVNAARAVAQSTGSAVGVSAANANLIAVAGTLSGMQLSGFEALDPRMFVTAPLPEEGLDSGAQGQDGRSVASAGATQLQSIQSSSFAGILNADSTIDFQDFFFAASAPQGLVPATAEFSEPVVSKGEFDSANNNGNEQASSIVEELSQIRPSEEGLQVDEAVTSQAEVAGSAEIGGGIQEVRGGVSQAANQAAAGINYATSSLDSLGQSVEGSGSMLGSSLLLEPTGFIYLSFGGGDVVQGSPYADTLFGSRAGDDILVGGTGNDTYVVYSASTQIQEAPLGGLQDTAYIGVDNYTAVDGVEQIRALNTEAYATKAQTVDLDRDGLEAGWRINGNGADQTLVGLYGADLLNGGGGADLLIGGMGDDVYFYSGAESILENADAGRDVVQTSANLTLASNIEIGIALPNSSDVRITGNALDNVLIGNAQANNLSGAAGNDTLVSQGGSDLLTGGSGADTFVLNGQDSFLGEITDFESGLDHIALAVSNPTVTLSMAPEDGFTGVAGQLWAIDGAVMIDWNGNAQFDSILLLNQTPLLSDFMLIDQNQNAYF
jgi:Ca2+-binding RTX toxin-like protein